MEIKIYQTSSYNLHDAYEIHILDDHYTSPQFCLSLCIYQTGYFVAALGLAHCLNSGWAVNYRLCMECMIY